MVYLNVENNNLTSKCLSSIKKLLCKYSSIVDLRLGKNEIDDALPIEVAYQIFKPYCKLKRLEINENNLSESGINAIFEAMVNNKSIEYLNFEGSMKCGIDRLRMPYLNLMLQTNETLKHLNLANCGIQDHHLRSLTDGLRNNMTLQVLNLSHNEAQKNYKEFAKVLSSSPLKSLDLSYNSISDLDGILIAQNLASNKTLETLNIKNNLLRESAG